MRALHILAAIVFIVFWSDVGFSRDFDAFQPGSLGAQPYLGLTPDLRIATLKDGYVHVPFVVKNIYTEDIAIILQWHKIDGLMAVDASCGKVPIEEFRNGRGIEEGGGPRPKRIILKPGESGTYDSISSMETLGFVVDKNTQVCGAITGRLVSTGQLFQSYSDPFSVPANLAHVPWVDLGERNYFVVKPDTSQSLLDGPGIKDRWIMKKPEYTEMLKSGCATSVLVPVEITNTTNQEYIVATDSVGFYIVREGSGRKPPIPWETINASKPILKPGESATSTGRCYIRLEELKSQGYKQGDKIVAAVGGRIPNTNQIFECYSTPFTLPPLPASRPPGSKNEPTSQP